MPSEEQLIAFPLVLPMGYVESPPYFCAITETVCDLANNLPTFVELPSHPLEVYADTLPGPEAETPVWSIDQPGSSPTTLDEDN